MAGEASNPVPGMTAHDPLEKPVVVIGPQFLQQYPVDLTIANDGKVTDVNGTVIFSVQSNCTRIHDRRHLKDAADNILVTLKEKIKTMHGRWQVFKGESTEEKDLLFSVKKSSLMQSRTQSDAFLASNPTSESDPDFKVKGSTIYLGGDESNVVVAEMFKRDRDNFAVRVYPNVDYAFIVGLVVVSDKMNAYCSGQVKEAISVATKVATPVAKKVAISVATKVAKPVAKEVATKMVKPVAKEVAKRVVTKVLNG
ncbi:hypothetical protein K2173_008416 [Erythroxylum novogranatense]|uniref:Uncharacterized protein n=1 Tax=Erythroxylum novogranatense TaxID=1862640 RepID=A0AAV8U913_9ROSI|nr:hypothetical protein K2173_008416 [Erythroxylum novogranatense]